MTALTRPPAQAFDAVAPAFDLRFGPWLSVAAQRRAVRDALLRAFPAGGRILELGGGTGEDALFLAQHGFRMHVTDPSPTMVSLASAKLSGLQARTEVVAGEEYEDFAARHLSAGGPRFDGTFSNFAPLNCIADLRPVAGGLAKLLKPDARAMLVIFGTCCPGEWITELLRGHPARALRRFRRDEVPARLGGSEFRVVYHRRTDLVRAFAPWFVLEKRLGIGITVPPSAAEPWISAHPRLLRLMETADSGISRAMAVFGDHILYQFRRTTTRDARAEKGRRNE